MGDTISNYDFYSRLPNIQQQLPWFIFGRSNSVLSSTAKKERENKIEKCYKRKIAMCNAKYTHTVRNMKQKR